MPIISYDNIKPKNLSEFSKLYKRACKNIKKIHYQLEKAYGRSLNRNELKSVYKVYFKIKHMAEKYKYLEEKLTNPTDYSS